MFCGWLWAQSCSLANADNTFVYSPGEAEIFRHTFDDDNGWIMPLYVVANGELHGRPDTNWMIARHPFSAPLAIDDGEVNVYWSFRTDANAGEDSGNLYLRLNLTDLPELIEQFNFTMNVRPGALGGPPHHFGFYSLYVDPGFNVAHTAEVALRPAVSFTNSAIHESFRLTLRKTGPDTVEAEPFWWNRFTLGWETILGITGTVPLTVSITNQMNGHQFIRSLEFQCFINVAYIDAVAVTQRAPTPRLTRLQFAGPTLGLDWTGGRPPYLVEATTNLTAGHWAVVATNATATATIQINQADRAAFVRVRSQ